MVSATVGSRRAACIVERPALRVPMTWSVQHRQIRFPWQLRVLIDDSCNVLDRVV